MNYIADTLGISIQSEPWDMASKLPFYLTDRYEFKKVLLGDVPCLFLHPTAELDTLPNLKKHILNVQKVEFMPIVFNVDVINARRRKSLIDARIPFVSPNIQLYLPFLGVALQEKYVSATPPSNILMPSSQLLFFHYLYNGENELFPGDTATKFNLSAMQISRAVRQLEELDLMTVRKDGVRLAISGTTGHRDLFLSAMPHLLNPVRRKIYVDYENIPNDLPQSGLSALSRFTMLNNPSTKTFALFSKSAKLPGADTLVDSAMQAEVEIWKYNPLALSSSKDVVDKLSLVTSLISLKDERVEIELENLLAGVLEEK